MNIVSTCDTAASAASGVAGGGIAFVIVFALFLFSDIGMTIYSLSEIGTDTKTEKA
jgi:hypothetical protein